MSKEEDKIEKDIENWLENKFGGNCSHKNKYNAGGGAVYGLGLIGALVYFIGHATTFWAGVLGIFQAIVWPAYLVYEAFNFLLK